MLFDRGDTPPGRDLFKNLNTPVDVATELKDSAGLHRSRIPLSEPDDIVHWRFEPAAIADCTIRPTADRDLVCGPHPVCRGIATVRRPITRWRKLIASQRVLSRHDHSFGADRLR